ncbi:MAG TPA: hypothetical protein VFR09_00825, partial [Alphaproteobacteria bacterium]|nr:hypothetical protein [Alphaproteobacteria bacterium]
MAVKPEFEALAKKLNSTAAQNTRHDYEQLVVQYFVDIFDGMLSPVRMQLEQHHRASYSGSKQSNEYHYQVRLTYKDDAGEDRLFASLGLKRNLHDGAQKKKPEALRIEAIFEGTSYPVTVGHVYYPHLGLTDKNLTAAFARIEGLAQKALA